MISNFFLVFESENGYEVGFAEGFLPWKVYGVFQDRVEANKVCTLLAWSRNLRSLIYPEVAKSSQPVCEG